MTTGSSTVESVMLEPFKDPALWRDRTSGGCDMSDEKKKESLADYRYFHTISTRWMDNDVYGHVNNVHYYSFFDTAVGAMLIKETGLDYLNGQCVALVVETRCTYFKSVAFPDVLKVGIRVARLGNSSVKYELAVFRADEDEPCAQGYFIHVYVDRSTQRPVPIPSGVRQVLEKLRVNDKTD